MTLLHRSPAGARRVLGTPAACDGSMGANRPGCECGPPLPGRPACRAQRARRDLATEGAGAERSSSSSGSAGRLNALRASASASNAPGAGGRIGRPHRVAWRGRGGKLWAAPHCSKYKQSKVPTSTLLRVRVARWAKPRRRYLWGSECYKSELCGLVRSELSS